MKDEAKRIKPILVNQKRPFGWDVISSGGIKDTDQNGLVCLLLDKNNAIIDSTIITEPLVTRYEYPGEDGTIGSKEVALDEKDVMIRSVYDPGMEYLRIFKVTGKTKRQSLATLKLPTPKM